MFLGQAQESFNIWFNIKPKIKFYLISKIKKNIKNFMIIIGLTGSVGAGKQKLANFSKETSSSF